MAFTMRVAVAVMGLARAAQSRHRVCPQPLRSRTCERSVKVSPLLSSV